jgi:Ca-activated chloride channel family protein
MRLTLFIIFALISYKHKSQIVFSTIKHDFGEVSGLTERYVDITLTNKGTKKEYILSVKKPSNVVYLVNGQFLDPDSSLMVRLQVNPTIKGRFSYEVQLYTSDRDDATIVKLSGNLIQTINEINPFQACPDFNSTPSKKSNATDFDLTVVTIDKQTKAIIPNTLVTILQNGMPLWSILTDKKAEIHQKTPLGFSYFYAKHPLYEIAEIGGYINFQRNYVVIEMEKKIVAEKVLPIEETSVLAENENLNQPLEDILNEEILAASNDSIIKSPTPFDQLDKNDFNSEQFKSVNVTFVLDISASMRAGEKMELMKYSLIQLTEMLRPQDKVTIVTYASETSVLLPTTSGQEKDKIKNLIKELKAGGMTAGGAGIKMGYKQTLRSFIENGTNQIVIITDGDFNRNSGDYKKHIKKYKKKGINMSVVGILNSEKDKKAMEEVAKIGGGRYIPIFKLSDAKENLKQEIRFICFKP